MPVLAGGDGLERVVVGDHADHDVGRRGDIARSVAPDQSVLDERGGLVGGPVRPVDVVAGGEQAACEAAAHRSEPNEADHGHAVHLPPALDLRHVGVGELQARAREDRINLLGAAEADDRAVHRRVVEGPRDRDRARRRAIPIGDALESIHKGEMA